MRDTPFRLAVIGTGAAARILHVPGALASPHVTIAALVDSVPARARQLARNFGLSPLIASDINAIVGAVDGALICTPNESHCPIAVALLERGIPCLVDKPLATTIEDGERMCRAAESAGKVLAVGYTTLYRDEVWLLKQILDERRFGRVRRFHFQEGTIGGWAPVSGYTVSRAASGGGVLTVVGVHFLDRMLFWFGYPDWCSLVDDSQGGPEAMCLARVRYGSGADAFDGTILLSKTFTLKPGLVVETDQGRIIFPIGTSPLYFVPHDASGFVTILSPTERRYPLEKTTAQLQIENFVAACRGLAPPMADGRRGLLAVRLLDELYGRRKALAEPWRDIAGAAA
jgi:predicted dehydrogenase